MAVISVPLSSELEAFVELLVRRGVATNKADAIRKAISAYAEEQAVFDVLRSEQEVRDGKVLSGDLRTLARKMK